MHNNAPAAKVSWAGQEVEPAGFYVVDRLWDPQEARELPGWSYGVGHLACPLVMAFGGGYSDSSNWKRILFGAYGGLKGKALSRAILKDGFDGIVTVDVARGSLSEIVLLNLRAMPPGQDILDFWLEGPICHSGTPEWGKGCLLCESLIQWFVEADMPQVELNQDAHQRLVRLAQITKKTEAQVVEEALAAYGWMPAKGLSVEAARMLLAIQGKDVMRIHQWVQDGVLTPPVVRLLGEIAMAEGDDFWLPACGGTEVVCRNKRGQAYLYCWNPAFNRHAYYLVNEDRFVDNLDEVCA